ncbi:MAG: AAA family ATPase [Bacilli bacterium]
MENIKIDFLTKDYDYAITLTKNILYHSPNISISILEEEDEIDESNFLICDYNCLCSKMDCYFVENADAKSEEGIYRYGQIKEIIGQIIYNYTIKSGHRICSFNNTSTKIISVISGSGGVGVTSTSIGIGRELAEFNKSKCLYINLNSISTDDPFFDKITDIKSLDFYLYYIINKNDEMNYCFDAFTISDDVGLMSFYDTNDLNTLTKISTDEYQEFLDIIIGTNYFDYIIIDCGNNINEKTIYSMVQSNIVYYYKTNNKINYDSRVISLLESHLQTTNNKLVPIIRRHKDEEGEFTKGDYIWHDDESFVQKGNKIMLERHKKFAVSVKELLEKNKLT